MGLETFSKKNKNFYVPDLAMTIGGGKITAKLLKSITDLKIEDQLDVGASFTITFRDILDLKTGNFELMDEAKLKPGNEVVISIGYQGNLEEGIEKPDGTKYKGNLVNPCQMDEYRLSKANR